ncbi:uncharacterized protein An11g01050 [Aspergillus niger]|uniref:Contig An11c0040, genomic contig n=2 Tax=Aspergillus niger TaxID=5061 RepID=A2QVD8_ASPNC|nr:uncharacterized protein An11g01050 [Aspergillus niger]CAK96895.1 unnamed protein product [Aspergillus niger]
MGELAFSPEPWVASPCPSWIGGFRRRCRYYPTKQTVTATARICRWTVVHPSEFGGRKRVSHWQNLIDHLRLRGSD